MTVRPVMEWCSWGRLEPLGLCSRLHVPFRASAESIGQYWSQLTDSRKIPLSNRFGVSLMCQFQVHGEAEFVGRRGTAGQ